MSANTAPKRKRAEFFDKISGAFKVASRVPTSGSQAGTSDVAMISSSTLIGNITALLPLPSSTSAPPVAQNAISQVLVSAPAPALFSALPTASAQASSLKSASVTVPVVAPAPYALTPAITPTSVPLAAQPALPTPAFVLLTTSTSAATTKPTLWDQAIAGLSQQDQKVFNLSQGKLDILNDILTLTEKQKDAHCEGGYKFAWRGNTIYVRDVLDRICKGVNKFKEIGDTIMQIDTAHGALPWAGVRLILQCGLNTQERLGSILLGIERVSNIIPVWTIYEAIFLGKNLDNEQILRERLSDVYSLTLTYLLKIYHFFLQSTASRVVKSAFLPNPVQEFLDKLAEKESALAELANLLHAEIVLRANDKNDQNYQNLKQILQNLGRPLRQVEATLKAISDTQNTSKLLLEDVADNLDMSYLLLKDVYDNLDDEKRNRILQWISSITYAEHYKAAVDEIVPGTCEWLLQTDYYGDWLKSTTSNVLWLRGDPGVGKTRLVAKVVESLKSFKYGHAYFFCKRGEGAERQSALQAFRAMIKQLSILDNGSLDEVVVQAYKEDEAQGLSSNGLPTVKECNTILIGLLNKRQSYIVLDALDECEQAERQLLLAGFLDITAKTNAKIFISSRHAPDIVFALQGHLHHVIEPKDNTEDIRRFVQSWISKNPNLFNGQKLSENLRHEVESTLLHMANGMFQWVVLTFQNLWALRSEQLVRKKLGKLPRGLKAAYDEIFDSITAEDNDDKEIAVGVLKWLLASYKTLNISDISCYIKWIHGDEMGIEAIIGMCRNLVTTDQKWDDYHSNYLPIRFSHLSVREYLIEHQFDEQAAHILCATTCLEICVKPDTDLSGPGNSVSSAWPSESDETSLFPVPEDQFPESNMPWRQYCCTLWPCHVKDATRIINAQNRMLIKNLRAFLGTHTVPGTGYSLWNGVMKHFVSTIFESSCESSIKDVFPYPSAHIWDSFSDSHALRYHICFVPHSSPEGLFLELEEDVDWMDDDRQYNTGSKEVVHMRHREVIHSIDSPMPMICYYGLYTMIPEIWNDFFTHGYQLDKLSGRTNCLQIAARCGHVGLVNYILVNDGNIDIDYDSPYYGTALLAASKMGYQEIVDALLHHGASPNIVGSPIGWNCGGQDYTNSGHDPNKFWIYYGTALCAAAAQCNGMFEACSVSTTKAIMDALIKRAVDVNLTDSYGRTPLLHTLIWKSDIEIIRHLLENGANPNTACRGFGTPIDCVIELHFDLSDDWYSRVLDLLLKFGALINETGKSYGSPLGTAAYQCSPGLVRELLERGADPNSPGGIYGSPYGCIHNPYLDCQYSENIYAIKVLLRDAGSTLAKQNATAPTPDLAIAPYTKGLDELIDGDLEAAQKSFAEVALNIRSSDFLCCHLCLEPFFRSLPLQHLGDMLLLLCWTKASSSPEVVSSICGKCAADPLVQDNWAWRYIELHTPFRTDLRSLQFAKIDISGNITTYLHEVEGYNGVSASAWDS